MIWRKARQPAVSVDYLIFGLGNPGPQYAGTRHNAGWWALDQLARRYKPRRTEHRLRGHADHVRMPGADGELAVALVKPTTLMNLSGDCLRAWRKEYPDAPFAIVYDDAAIPAGKLRLRARGSAGGHNGLRSIIAALGGQEFDRLRIGIGEPPAGEDYADYVLSAPSRSEREAIESTLPLACDLLELLVSDGFDAAQRKMAQLGNVDTRDSTD